MYQLTGQPSVPSIAEEGSSDLEQGTVAALSTDSTHSATVEDATAVEAVPSSIRDCVTLATHALGSYVEGRVYHNSMKPHYEVPPEYTKKLAELGSCVPEHKQKLAALMFVLVMLLKSPKNRKPIIDGYMCQNKTTFDGVTRTFVSPYIHGKDWDTFFNNLTFAACEDLEAAFDSGGGAASALAKRLKLRIPSDRTGTSSSQDDVQSACQVEGLLQKVQSRLENTEVYCSVLRSSSPGEAPRGLLELLDCVELNKLHNKEPEQVFTDLMKPVCRDLCQIGSQGALIVHVFLQKMVLKKQILFAGYKVKIYDIPPPKRFMKETLDMLIRSKDFSHSDHNASAEWSVSDQEEERAPSDAEDSHQQTLVNEISRVEKQLRSTREFFCNPERRTSEAFRPTTENMQKHDEVLGEIRQGADAVSQGSASRSHASSDRGRGIRQDADAVSQGSTPRSHANTDRGRGVMAGASAVAGKRRAVSTTARQKIQSPDQGLFARMQIAGSHYLGVKAHNYYQDHQKRVTVTINSGTFKNFAEAYWSDVSTMHRPVHGAMGSSVEGNQRFAESMIQNPPAHQKGALEYFGWKEHDILEICEGGWPVLYRLLYECENPEIQAALAEITRLYPEEATVIDAEEEARREMKERMMKEGKLNAFFFHRPHIEDHLCYIDDMDLAEKGSVEERMRTKEMVRLGIQQLERLQKRTWWNLQHNSVLDHIGAARANNVNPLRLAYRKHHAQDDLIKNLNAKYYAFAAYAIQRHFMVQRVPRLRARRVALRAERQLLMHLKESATHGSVSRADRDDASPQKQRFGIIQARGIAFRLLYAWVIVSVVLYLGVTLSVLGSSLTLAQLTAGIGVGLVGVVLLLDLCSMMRRRGDALDGQGPSIISPPLSSVEVGKPSPQESAAHKQPLSPSSSLEVGGISISVLR